MKLRNGIILGSSLALLMIPSAMVSAQTENDQLEWQARSVADVEEDIVYQSEDQVTYTIQYGDTLSVIAEAMEVNLTELAAINEIYDVDLIYPETQLSATYNQEEAVANLTVETPEGQIIESSVALESSSTPETAEISEAVLEIESTETDTTDAELPVDQSVIDEDPWLNSEDVFEEKPDLVFPEPTPAPEPTQPVNGGQTGQEEEVVEDDTYIEEEPIQVNPEPEVVPEETAEVLVDPEAEAEIPAEVYDDLQYVETIEEEDVVTEDREEVEEIVDEPTSPEFDPMANPENANLQPHVAAFKEEVASKYGIESFSNYRPGDPGDHGQGLAVDFMVYDDAQLGDQVAQYSIDNMAEHNISYVIWQQQIYGEWDPQWQAMEDRGSVTANHYDHVHVSFN